MGYDNSQRFRYRVIARDCILPDADGVMRRCKKGAIVTGPHYKKLLPTGVLEAIPGEQPEVAKALEFEDTPGEKTPPVEADKSAGETEEKPDYKAPEVRLATKEELMAISKASLKQMFPHLKGTKAEMVEDLLDNQTVLPQDEE